MVTLFTDKSASLDLNELKSNMHPQLIKQQFAMLFLRNKEKLSI